MRKVVLCVFMGLTSVLGAPPKGSETTLPVLIYGSPTAKLEVIEFSSMYCSACEHFKHTTFVEIEQNYISKGQLRWIRIPFAIDFGDVLILAYMKHLSLDQRQSAEAWYQSFRQHTSFSSEEEFHKELLMGLKEQFQGIKDMQPINHHEIDEILRETVRLAEQFNLNHYPTFLIDGECISVSKIKHAIEDKLRHEHN